MKNLYVILAFHAHELLWDLPEVMLSYLEAGNPMKDTVLETNYLRKRQQEGRNIYWRCSDFGDRMNAPLCVEFSNELLFQVKEVLPETFAKLTRDYRRGRLYPLYGHAHHTNIALLSGEEMTQEIVWNMQFVHQLMGAPYPKYRGVFPTEDSLDYGKLDGFRQANVDYVIFPQLRPGEIPFEVTGEGDYIYKPFVLETGRHNLLAFHRNFSISQEIWRPITKMKRDELESQGYLLGNFPVFYNEYLNHEVEEFPITLEEGVEIYRRFLREEVERAPDQGVLVYVQDLELMDFGDIALEIMEKAWSGLLREVEGRVRIDFVTPDTYIDRVVAGEDIDRRPRVRFGQISWAPEMRVVLRPDGHYPPAGVGGVDGYDFGKTGFYQKPLVFWENGKYFTGIFDALLEMFNISINIPADAVTLDSVRYHVGLLDLNSQAVIYHRLMKRACNWGWVPTEGRQKRPALKGYLVCDILLRLLNDQPAGLLLNRAAPEIDLRCLVGILESLRVFVDMRIEYLNYGIERLAGEKEVDCSQYCRVLESAREWKRESVEGVRRMYSARVQGLPTLQQLRETLLGMQQFCQGLFMATEQIQKIWALGDSEFLVEKMYEFLFKVYPPLFPEMIQRIDAMDEEEVGEYFYRLAEQTGPAEGWPHPRQQPPACDQLWVQ